MKNPFGNYIRNINSAPVQQGKGKGKGKCKCIYIAHFM